MYYNISVVHFLVKVFVSLILIVKSFECYSKKDDELSILFEELWKLDKNRGEPNSDWEVNVQGSLQGTKENTDVASGNLFKFVNEKIFQKPTYKAFINILDNYESRVGVNEVVTAQEEMENQNFLNEIVKTPVMKMAHQYLIQKKLAPTLETEFKALLNKIWFGLYNRKSSKDTSGFEHVFVGETKDGEILGLHNWVQFYLQEKAGNIDYAGHHKKSCYKDARLFTIGLKWNKKSSKHFSSILIGSSPEFEMALYSVVYLTSKQRFKNNKWEAIGIQTGPCFVNIQCFEMRGEYIGTCYVK